MNHPRRPDVTCSIACGECCTLWRKIPEFYDIAERKNTRDACPHQGENGCKLNREDRPKSCRSFLCDKGELAWRREQGVED